MRILIFVALASASALASLTPTIGHAAAPVRPACAVPVIVGSQTCYSPAQVRAAERSVGWAVRPSAAVNLRFGLKLSQVSVITAPGKARPTQIDYLYGPLRLDYGRQKQFPIAIRISEWNARADVSRFQPRWTHDVCGTRVEISPAADPQRAHPRYGPWYLIANFPHGNRSLGIVANAGPRMLEGLACDLLRAG